MYTAVEAGVALAGFSALIIALRQRDDRSLSTSDRMVVASLVERGLMAALFAFLPILLFGFDLSAAVVWLICSGAFFVYGTSIFVRAMRSRRQSARLVPAVQFYPLVVIGILIIILQLLHALGVGITQSVWWYLTAVTWLLVSAGYRFFYVLLGWIREN